ncbi:MAG: histidine kinase [Bacteroidota bacterium]
MNTSFKTTSGTMAVYLHLAFWLFIGVVNLLVFNWFVTTQQVFLRTMINLAFLALLFYVNANLLVNRFLERKKYLSYFLLVAALVCALVPVRVKINLLFPVVNPTGLEQASQMKGLIFGALATNIGIVLLSTIYQVLVNRYAEERHTLALISRQNEAQLQFLRAQINPHFLFNTLNNIYSLAVVRSPKTADMVLQLSDLLRYVIYDSREEKVPLEKEAAHIRKFILLFQMRSEEALDIQFKITGNLAGILVEPMILIPMVENCFKHCDFDTNPAAFAKIELTVEDNCLIFKTINTKNYADRQKDSTGGVGLENIRRRL